MWHVVPHHPAIQRVFLEQVKQASGVKLNTGRVFKKFQVLGNRTTSLQTAVLRYQFIKKGQHLRTNICNGLFKTICWKSRQSVCKGRIISRAIDNLELVWGKPHDPPSESASLGFWFLIKDLLLNVGNHIKRQRSFKKVVKCFDCKKTTEKATAKSSSSVAP